VSHAELAGEGGGATQDSAANQDAQAHALGIWLILAPVVSFNYK